MKQKYASKTMSKESHSCLIRPFFVGYLNSKIALLGRKFPKMNYLLKLNPISLALLFFVAMWSVFFFFFGIFNKLQISYKISSLKFQPYGKKYLNIWYHLDGIFNIINL